MTKREIAEARSQYVAMGNELIQKKRYNLSLLEQKLVLFMVSKITPYDEPNKDYIFSYNEFEAVCNLNKDGGKTKKSVYEMLRELSTHPLEVQLSVKQTLITHWFNNAVFDDETDTVKLDFSKYLVPYLNNLQTLYTQFCLENVLAMKSKYSVRLYEYLKSVKNLGFKHPITLEELKRVMGAENYDLYKDFRVRALTPALEEINKYTDLEVSYVERKTGKRVTAIEFKILAANEPTRFINRDRALNNDA